MSDATTIEQLDFSTNLLRAMLWQHNTATQLEALVRAKDNWYQTNQRDFWTNWVKDVFDLRTANAFGLQVWSRILGIPLQVAITPSNPLVPGWGFASADTMPAFARASSATYRNPTTGLLTTVGNNIPRYRGTNKTGLMIEEAATNVWGNSNDFQTGLVGTATYTTGVLDPAGGNNATKATAPTIGPIAICDYNNTAANRHIVAQPGDFVTMTIFGKMDPGVTYVQVGMYDLGGVLPIATTGRFDLINGKVLLKGPFALGCEISETYANGFFRVAVRAQLSAAAPINDVIGPFITFNATAAGQSVTVYGLDFKIENGVSSYIDTTGQPTGAARAADIPGVTATANRNYDHGGFSNANGGTAGLSVEQQRILLRLRYYQLISRCTVPDINRICAAVFSELGTVYVLDGNDMSYVIYVFDFSPGSQLSFLLEQYDLLPRPAGVGVKYNIITRPVFGFGQFNKNFDNGTFAKDTK